MNYKGYEGKIEYDEDSERFFGRVINIRDIITFQGKSVSELKKSFKESIEDYLAFCTERNEKPDRLLDDQNIIKIPKRLHKKIYKKAIESHQNLNTWVAKILEKSV